MKFQFKAFTPAIDHEIEARVADQIAAAIPPDTQVLWVEIGTWIENHSGWEAVVEVTYRDGAEPLELTERIRQHITTPTPDERPAA